MTRLDGRYTRKTNSGTSGDGRQSKPEVVAYAGGRRSADTGRRHFSMAGTESMSGMAVERHDWLVPMELL